MALTVWENVTVTGQYAGLVASSWKGQTYLRSAPAKVNNNSPKQQQHKLLYKFAYYHISPFYNIFIKNMYQATKMTPANYIIKNLPKNYWQAKTPVEASTRFIYPYMGLNCTVNWNFARDNEHHKIIGNLITFTGQDKDKATKFIFFVVPYSLEDYTKGHEETQSIILPITETHIEITFNAETFMSPKPIFYCVANNTQCSAWHRW